MNIKLLSSITIITTLCILVLTGCSKNVSVDITGLQTDISSISVPDHVQIVGLGEASHGAKEYQQMKGEVFKALVNNNDCRTFIIEGDFGGALKVDAYIHGGSGTAEDIVREIGFSIYNTQEMVDLIEWMRSYNEIAFEGEDLHFYGMDMQRYDNSKEYLFSVLDATIPEMSKKYKSAFKQLTDANRLELGTDVLEQASIDALELIEEMDAVRNDIIEIIGQEKFDIARECANSIYMCSDVLMSNDKEYNTLRDNYMFEKVEWFMQQVEGLLFINGHNGHIGKKSTANYTCLGELLYNSIGEEYYSIGTDSLNTEFNSQGSNGEFCVMKVENRNLLKNQFANMESELYYIDFSKVVNDEEWKQILSSEQTITTLNVGIEEWQKLIKSFYTTTIVPEEMFDGMIVFQSVSPTTLIIK